MKKSLTLLVLLFGLLAGLWAQKVESANATFKAETASVEHVSATKGNLAEGFEGTVFPPDGWKIINGGDPNTWVRRTSTPITGTASAAISYNSAAHDDYLITPPLAPVTGNSTLSFKSKNQSSSYVETFNVKLSTTGNNVADFTVVLATDVAPTTAAQTFTYDLSAYIGQTVYIAIQSTSTDMYVLYADDFAGPPIYITPPNLVTTGLNKSYSKIPQSQLNSALVLQAKVRNTGADLSTATDVNFSLENASKAVLFSNTKQLAPIANSTEQIISADAWNSTSLTTGNYVINYNAPLTGDFDLTNNADAFNFAVTDYMYGTDKGVFTGSIGNSSAVTFGNAYEINSPTTWSGVEIGWGTAALATNLNFQIALYNVDATNAVVGSPIYTSGNLVKTPTDPGTVKYYPLAPLAIPAGRYILAIKQLTTTRIEVALDGATYGTIYVANTAITPATFPANTTLGNVAIRMELAPKKTITFNVLDGTTPLANAIVTVKQGATTVATSTTDASGNAPAYLLPGTFTYSVTNIGYNALNNVGFTVTDNATINVAMTAAVPTFEINPTIKNFGTVFLASTAVNQIFTITNIGSGTMTINPADVNLVNNEEGNFALTNITETQNLTVGQSFTVTVAFLPITIGSKTAQLKIQDNLSKTLNSVELSGVGITSYTTAIGGFNEGFEGPTLISLAGSGWGYSTYGGAHTGSKWYYTATENGTLIFPKMTIVDKDCFDFWYRAEGSTVAQDAVVKLSTTTNDIAEFTTTLKTYTGFTNTAYINESIDLSAYVGQSVYIAIIKTNVDAAEWGFCLDDVKFWNNPSLAIGDNATPATNSLSQNYPNPFNPETTINFALANNSNIQLAVYNAKGEIVKELVNEVRTAGYHSVKFNANGLNSGVYFYKLTTPEKTMTQKMLLVK